MWFRTILPSIGAWEALLKRPSVYYFVRPSTLDATISASELLKKLDNLADMEIAQQIMEGTVDTPKELDKATVEILEGIGRL